MMGKTYFSRAVVLKANARLVEQKGRPTRLPEELLGIVCYRPRTIEEIKSAFASAYTNLKQVL